MSIYTLRKRRPQSIEKSLGGPLTHAMHERINIKAMQRLPVVVVIPCTAVLVPLTVQYSRWNIVLFLGGSRPLHTQRVFSLSATGPLAACRTPYQVMRVRRSSGHEWAESFTRIMQRFSSVVCTRSSFGCEKIR